MTDQERRLAKIERAYRLAWPDDPSALDVRTPEVAWGQARSWLEYAEDADAALSWAILALALLDGGGTLGRWRINRIGPWRIHDGGVAGGTVASQHGETWLVDLAPGSYLDGTAQELLLLIAAADELSRREVQS